MKPFFSLLLILLTSFSGCISRTNNGRIRLYNDEFRQTQTVVLELPFMLRQSRTDVHKVNLMFQKIKKKGEETIKITATVIKNSHRFTIDKESFLKINNTVFNIDVTGIKTRNFATNEASSTMVDSSSVSTSINTTTWTEDYFELILTDDIIAELKKTSSPVTMRFYNSSIPVSIFWQDNKLKKIQEFLTK